MCGCAEPAHPYTHKPAKGYRGPTGDKTPYASTNSAINIAKRQLISPRTRGLVPIRFKPPAGKPQRKRRNRKEKRKTHNFVRFQFSSPYQASTGPAPIGIRQLHHNHSLTTTPARIFFLHSQSQGAFDRRFFSLRQVLCPPSGLQTTQTSFQKAHGSRP